METIRSLSFSIRLISIISLLVPSITHARHFFSHGGGTFLDDITAKWIDDGRTMELLQEVRFVDIFSKTWSAPKDSKIDGASIPRIFWSLIGGPFEGRYRKASVVHDYYCQVKSEPWQLVHWMFFDACIAAGENKIKAKTMFAAVWAGGPRWDKINEVMIFRNCDISQSQLNEINEWINTNDPPLRDIIDRLEPKVIDPAKALYPDLDTKRFDLLDTRRYPGVS